LLGHSLPIRPFSLQSKKDARLAFLFAQPICGHCNQRYSLPMDYLNGIPDTLCFLSHDESLFTCWRSLEIHWLKWIGSVCYRLYIWQQLFLVQGLKVQESSLLWFQRFPQNYIFAFLIGIASFYLIEEYFRKRGYEWIQRMK
jgi:peptidoglycan/LPS O-acetylase OafA/YrhL